MYVYKQESFVIPVKLVPAGSKQGTDIQSFQYLPASRSHLIAGRQARNDDQTAFMDKHTIYNELNRLRRNFLDRIYKMFRINQKKEEEKSSVSRYESSLRVASTC